MTDHTLCDQFQTGLASLFTCETRGDYVRVRTPYLYPDGDVIDLFLKAQDDTITVSDFGETTRWLRMQTTSPRRSPKQNVLIEDVVATHEVEFFRGMLQARCRPDDDLSTVSTRVAQAALRVSDLWFTFRTRAVGSFNDEVADFLVQFNLPYERNEKIPGRSGKIWTPDFHVRAPQRSSLVYALSTGNKSSARSLVNHVHTAFYDLSYLNTGKEATRFITLFDDTTDVWGDEDFALAEQLSQVTRWSQTDDFAELLQAS